jgi:hypothetical protein
MSPARISASFAPVGNADAISSATEACCPTHDNPALRVVKTP